ncbi:MAG: DNA-processing protein DprA [Chitinophagales bacterium]
MEDEILYGIALSLLKGIGDANAKTLISYAGSAKQLFGMSTAKLQKINGIGPKTAAIFKDTKQAIQRAEKEMKFMQQHQIDVHFYYQKTYPKRLLNCVDAPLFIFSKGNVDFNKEKIVSVVGTRHCTEQGRAITEKLIADLAIHDITLVSGLAYGIDICAHKAALKYNMQNIAVLAHGLDRIYPFQHKNIADKLQENGAIISDFISQTNPDKQNFPSRNRIVAGMSDATIVVESAEEGGALITAEIANSYNRDVFAFPGRVDDKYSVGCLRLIKQNKAQLVCAAQDIIECMSWDIDTKKQNENKSSIQTQLFSDFNADEQKIIHVLQAQSKSSIDELYLKTALTPSNIATLLLNLELKGVVQMLPGKYYRLVN